MVSVQALALLAAGTVLLYVGAELLVAAAGNIARGLGLRAATVGVTVVALVTTAPELVVATVGVVTVSTDIGLGMVIGSNVANIGLVLGIAAVIRPLEISDAVWRRHVPFMVLAAVLLALVSLNGEITRIDGVVLLGVLAGFTGVLLVGIRTQTAMLPETPGSLSVRDGAYAVGGLVALYLGSRWLIDGGHSLLAGLGVSDLVIGLTVIALGTALPELAASAIGAARGHAEFAVGNVVGSNIYNVLAVVGILALAVPIPVDPGTLRVEFPILIGFTLLLVVLMGRDRRLDRSDGVVLLIAYAGFLAILFT